MFYAYAHFKENKKDNKIVKFIDMLFEKDIPIGNFFIETSTETSRKNSKLYKLLSLLKYEDTIYLTDINHLSNDFDEFIAIINILKFKKIKLNIGDTCIFDIGSLSSSLSTQSLLKLTCLGTKKINLPINLHEDSPIFYPEFIPAEFCTGYKLYLANRINKKQLAKLTNMNIQLVDEYINLINQEKKPI